MARVAFVFLSFFLLSAEKCSNHQSGRQSAMYGPLVVKSIQNVQVAPLDCDNVEPDMSLTAKVTMTATAAQVCANEEACGDEYLALNERTFEVPHIFNEEDDQSLDYIGDCGRQITGIVWGEFPDGKHDVGLLEYALDQDRGGCAVVLRPEQTRQASSLSLEILVSNNAGILLGHEDYAPVEFRVEVPLSCK